jgi:hypothetical protein
VEGDLAWLDEGLADTESVRGAVEDYRKGSNPFAQWMDARMVRDDEARVRATLLYNDYKTWCEDNGHEKPMSQRAFGAALGDLQIMFAGKDGDGKVTRRGARLRQLADGAEAWPRSRISRGRAPAAPRGLSPSTPPNTRASTDDARPRRQTITDDPTLVCADLPRRGRWRDGGSSSVGAAKVRRESAVFSAGYRQTDDYGRFPDLAPVRRACAGEGRADGRVRPSVCRGERVEGCEG